MIDGPPHAECDKFGPPQHISFLVHGQSPWQQPQAAARKDGFKACSFDIDPERVKESLENVKKNLVEIKQQDILPST